MEELEARVSVLEESLDSLTEHIKPDIDTTLANITKMMVELYKLSNRINEIARSVHPQNN